MVSNLRSASFTLDIGLQRALGGGYQTAPASTLASARKKAPQPAAPGPQEHRTRNSHV